MPTHFREIGGSTVAVLIPFNQATTFGLPQRRAT
jgi:hypothetical protein